MAGHETNSQSDLDRPTHQPADVNPAAASSDEAVLERYLQGDKACFEILVERYQRELYHFLTRFLGDRTLAEDVFQETFLQVHQSAGQFNRERKFRPWLFTIAANKARDTLRSTLRRPMNPLQASIDPTDEGSAQFVDLMQATDLSPDVQLEQADLQRLVQATVQAMPDHLREVLLLSYFHHFSYRQISEMIHVPLGTIKSRLHAAVAHFAKAWIAKMQNHPPLP